MSKQTSVDSNDKRIIDTGGGAYIEGNVDVNGGDFVGRDQYSTGLGPADIKQLFEPIYRQIEALPNAKPEDKADLKADVEEIQDEVIKGDELDETFLARRLRNIARASPDIFEVIISTLSHPVAGLATVVKKIAEKAKGTGT